MGTGSDILLRKMGFQCTLSLPSPRLSPFLFQLSYLISHISCASSKHLQTRRFLDTLQGYLLDIQRLLIQLHRSANERPAPFVDHLGILRDSKTGRPINGTDSDEEEVEFAMREFLFFSFPFFPLYVRDKRRFDEIFF